MEPGYTRLPRSGERGSRVLPGRWECPGQKAADSQAAQVVTTQEEGYHGQGTEPRLRWNKGEGNMHTEQVLKENTNASRVLPVSKCETVGGRVPAEEEKLVTIGQVEEPVWMAQRCRKKES